jgi:hypothetical protein
VQPLGTGHGSAHTPSRFATAKRNIGPGLGGASGAAGTAVAATSSECCADTSHEPPTLSGGQRLSTGQQLSGGQQVSVGTNNNGGGGPDRTSAPSTTAHHYNQQPFSLDHATTTNNNNNPASSQLLQHAASHLLGGFSSSPVAALGVSGERVGLASISDVTGTVAGGPHHSSRPIGGIGGLHVSTRPGHAGGGAATTTRPGRDGGLLSLSTDNNTWAVGGGGGTGGAGAAGATANGVPNNSGGSGGQTLPLRLSGQGSINSCGLNVNGMHAQLSGQGSPSALAPPGVGMGGTGLMAMLVGGGPADTGSPSVGGSGGLSGSSAWQEQVMGVAGLSLASPVGTPRRLGPGAPLAPAPLVGASSGGPGGKVRATGSASSGDSTGIAEAAVAAAAAFLSQDDNQHDDSGVAINGVARGGHPHPTRSNSGLIGAGTRLMVGGRTSPLARSPLCSSDGVGPLPSTSGGGAAAHLSRQPSVGQVQQYQRTHSGGLHSSLSGGLGLHSSGSGLLQQHEYRATTPLMAQLQASGAAAAAGSGGAHGRQLPARTASNHSLPPSNGNGPQFTAGPGGGQWALPPSASGAGAGAAPPVVSSPHQVSSPVNMDLLLSLIADGDGDAVMDLSGGGVQQQQQQQGGGGNGRGRNVTMRRSDSEECLAAALDMGMADDDLSACAL